MIRGTANGMNHFTVSIVATASQSLLLSDCVFSTVMWNSREDDPEQGVDISHFQEGNDTLIPGAALTEDNSRTEDKVCNDR